MTLLILDYIIWLTFWCAALVVISGAVIAIISIAQWIKNFLR